MAPPRHRPLVGVAAAFAGGIWVGDRAGLFETPLSTLAAGAIALAALLSFAWAWRARFDSLRTLPVLLGCLGVGLLRVHLVSDTPPNSIDRFEAHGQPVRVKGTIAGPIEWSDYRPETVASRSVPRASESGLSCRIPVRVAEMGPAGGRMEEVSGDLEIAVSCPGGLSYRDLVRVREIPDIYGTECEVLGRLAAIRGPRNPGQADSSRRGARDAIRRRVLVNDWDQIVPSRDRIHLGLLSLASQCRARLLRRIAEMSPPPGGSPPTGDEIPRNEPSQFLACLLLGERAAIDKSLAERFLRSGTVHFLAVSGMHVLLIMLPIEWLLWQLRVRGRTAVVVLIVGAVGYAFLTGLSASVVRAAVMYVCVRASVLVWRRRDSISALAAAAILILAFDPGALWNAGFQLSFVSVLALICVAAPLARIWLGPEERMGAEPPPWPKRIWTRLWRGTATLAVISLVCWCATVPIVLRTFHIVSPIALLANVLIAAPMELLIVVGMSTIALGLLWAPLATPGIVLASWLISLTDGLLTQCLRVPNGYFYWPAPWDLTVVCWYGGLVGLLCRRRPGWAGQNARTAACAAPLAVAALLYLQFSELRPKTLRVTALDVGQGACTLLEMPDGAAYLYDCGTRGDFDVGRRIVAEALWSRGITRLDGIILSHADSDHTSGVVGLTRVVPCPRVHVWGHEPEATVRPAPPTGETPRGTAVADRHALYAWLMFGTDPGRLIRHPEPGTIAAGEGWQMALVSSPSPDSIPDRVQPESTNNMSMVVRVTTSDGHSVLLPGDIEEEGIRALLGRRVPLGSEVLLAPHHGSDTSWDPGLWDAVRPRHLLVSADPKFPSLEVLEEYRSRGTQVWWTAECGAVTLTARAGGGWRVETVLHTPGAESGDE